MTTRGLAVLVLLAASALAACSRKPKPEALVEAAKAGDRERVEDLLERGADPDDSKARDPSFGLSPLCLAARAGDVEMVRTLLSHHADANRSSGIDGDDVPLKCAIWSGNVEVVRALLAAGARPDGDLDETRPLGTAAEKGNLPALEALLAAGADVNGAAESGLGYPPLRLAAGNGHIECVRRLLAAKADLERSDRLGQTALMVAVTGEHAEVVALLLERGADPLAPNRAGHTPAFASQWKSEAIQKLLRDHGVTQWGMREPPSLPGGGPYIRVPVVEVEASGAAR